MLNKRIYFFIGTTAELIKVSPVIRELQRRKIKFKIITSGQGKVFFEELSDHFKTVKVDIAFMEKINRSSIFYFAVWALKTFFVSLFTLRNEFRGLNKTNSYFIVHGDTVSSLIGVLIATLYGLKLVHIESGLRSFNFLEPFPEEICRFIISYLADVHFCPNDWCLENLSNKRGIKINTYKNTLIESFWWAFRQKKKPLEIKGLERGRKYFVLVVHRQEHVIFGKDWTKDIIEYVLSQVDPRLTCVFITHLTALDFLNSSNLFSKYIRFNRRLIIARRLSYVYFMSLLNNAEFMVTDGGSNQEEASYMGKPCLLLRNHTERIEGLGKNVILSKGKRSLIKSFLRNYKNFKMKKIYVRTFPSRIIVDYLTKN